DAELHVLGGGDLGDELGAFARRRAQLQMRVAWTGEAAAAQQRPAQVGAAAARAPDDAFRRPLERRARCGAHADVAQEGERAARGGRVGEIEVDSERAAAEMPGARRVEERRELGEPAAAARGRDRGELVPQLVRRDHRWTPSSASMRRLYSTPRSPKEPIPF